MKSTLSQIKSENAAGIISLMGSTALAFHGDVNNVISAAVFTAAEVTIARYGHKTAGYSAAATLFAAGDLTLAFSDSVEGGSALQITLLGMAGAWSLGALRYPLDKVAEKYKMGGLGKIAETLPAVCGSGNLALRLPGIFSAAASQNYILAGAIAAWGVADVLAGRLQQRVKPLLQFCLR